MGRQGVEIPLAELKRQLRQMSQPALVDLVLRLCKQQEGARAHVAAQVRGSSVLEPVLQRQKAAMQKVFAPGKLRLAGAKQLISDFRKLSPSAEQLLDLMLHYVELGVSFTNTYGDVSGPFYASLLRVYRDVIDRLAGEGNAALTWRLAPRLAAVVAETSGLGWGFHDALAEAYGEFESEQLDTAD